MVVTVSLRALQKALRCLAGNLFLIVGVAAALWLSFVSIETSHSTEAYAIGGEKGSKSWLKQSEIGQMEKSILRYTNEERVRNGLKPLRSSDALAFLAKNQSQHMCKSGRLAHESDTFPEGWRKLIQRLTMASLKSGAENIALRTVESDKDAWAKSVVKGWMSSPPHKKNILEPTHRYLGVGVSPCENRIAYATQIFSSDPGTIP
jgi:uncharacterized protein YkwD